MKRKFVIALIGAVIIPTLMSGTCARAETLTESYLEYEAYRSTIPGMCEEIGDMYGISPELLQAIIERESRGEKYAENNGCKGLCQISEKCHRERMQKLGITDIYDEFSNIMLCADYLNELIQIGIDTGRGDDISYALMRYSMKTETANRLWDSGIISSYATDILERAAELEAEHKK